MKEKELWFVVERMLKGTGYGCSKTWRSGSGASLGHIEAGMGHGQPDVIGVSTAGKFAGIHVVEGKLLHASRNKFNETTSQLKDWYSHGDYLWAAFAKSDWEQIKAEQRKIWEHDLQRDGIGLVLVDGKKHEVPFVAAKNLSVKVESQNLIRKKLGLEQVEQPIPFFSLGRMEALAASQAAAWCLSVFEMQAKKVASADKQKLADPIYDENKPLFHWDGWLDLKNRRSITADPFGSMAGNGIPGLLVWRSVNDIASLPTKVQPPGAFLYMETDIEDVYSKICPLSEAHRIGTEERKSYNSFFLFWQVPIEGRTRLGIQNSLQEIWDQIRELKS